jgi:hypothetical protein
VSAFAIETNSKKDIGINNFFIYDPLSNLVILLLCIGFKPFFFNFILYRAILSQLRALFEKEGESRFESENHPNTEGLYTEQAFLHDNAGFRIFMAYSELRLRLI